MSKKILKKLKRKIGTNVNLNSSIGAPGYILSEENSEQDREFEDNNNPLSPRNKVENNLPHVDHPTDDIGDEVFEVGEVEDADERVRTYDRQKQDSIEREDNNFQTVSDINNPQGEHTGGDLSNRMSPQPNRSQSDTPADVNLDNSHQPSGENGGGEDFLRDNPLFVGGIEVVDVTQPNHVDNFEPEDQTNTVESFRSVKRPVSAPASMEQFKNRSRRSNKHR